MARPVSAEPTTELHPQRSVPPFLIKTYQLVEDPSINDLISWNSDGSSFVVWRPAEFARDLLPKYFKHNNFSSFVRQLNTYGFRKVAGDRWEFTNEYFQRGEKKLLKGITRKKGVLTTPFSGGAVAAVPLNQIKAGVVKNTPTTTTSSRSNSEEGQVVSTSNSSGGCCCYGGLKKDEVNVGWRSVAEENERLRKENARLAKELSELRLMWDNVYKLVSSYARIREEEEDGDVGREVGVAEGTKLFGVSIGEKRVRVEEGGGDDGVSRKRMLMKSEPLILG